MLNFPLILINLKTYKESTGANASAIARAAEQVAQKTGASICVAVQALDLAQVASQVKIPVIAQHVDEKEHGKHTGYILAAEVLAHGGKGTLLNHSEHKLSFPLLKKTIELCKNAKLPVIVCCTTVAEAKRIDKFHPDCILLEQPELIAGKISVAQAKPELILSAVKAVSSPILCGAGVNNAADVNAALRFGTQGIGLSNAVCSAKNPYEKILELAQALVR